MLHRTRDLSALSPMEEMPAADRNHRGKWYITKPMPRLALPGGASDLPGARVVSRDLDTETAAQHDALDAVMLRLQSHDHDALAELYDSTIARVLALARAMLRDPADAEELVCDVYERAWLRADTFDAARGTVLAWLLAICRTQALDRLRKRRALLRKHEAFSREPEETSVKGPEYFLDRFQNGHAVHAALTSLMPLRQKLLDLSFFRGLSHKEIAEELDMPLGTVKSHLRRALLELRDRLGLDGTYDEN
jgi:RNA polymerase sigma-70 factor (ECF subfamily)